MSAVITRRDFLRVSGTVLGGLAVSAWLPPLRGQDADKVPAWLRNSLDLFVRVEPDERVYIGARCCEIGQGVRTSLPMLIAEELDVDWAKVTVEQLPYGLVAADTENGLDFRFGDQGVGGSTSVTDAWLDLRQVGARVRNLILQAAAKRWNVPLDSLETDHGYVVHRDGRRLGYGELANLARTMPVAEERLPLKPARRFRIIGREAKVTDGVDIVTGRARYGIDGDIPGSLVAVIARCPYFEGTLASLDDSAARAIPGVRGIVKIPGPTATEGLVRNLAAGVAVVADDTWSAMQGRRALRVTWQPGEWSADDTDAFREAAGKAVATPGQVARRDGDPAAVRAVAAQVVEATYFQPFLAHCTMEPMNANLELNSDSARLIASVQNPSGASRMINAMTGIDRLRIDIQLPRAGGGFGRRLENDFVAEAVHVARAVKRPVKLIWSREDDMQHDWYRPSGAHGMTAFLDDRRALTGWLHRVAASDRRFRLPGRADSEPWLGTLDPDAFPAGCVAAYEASFSAVPLGIPRGWWRGPLPTFTAFPIQSFMDEVAAAAGQDPLAFRLKLLGQPRELKYGGHGGPVLHTGRMAAVLRQAAKRIGYGRALPPGHGIGLAVHFVFGGYTAHAMEVSVDKGKVTVHRCACAVDIGQPVNPLGVEAQMMGATLDGISTALHLEITVKKGQVQQQNFPDYSPLRMADAPDVDVDIVRTDFPMAGAGEMGIPTAAPALVNAIFAATGKRIRRLPVADQLA